MVRHKQPESLFSLCHKWFCRYLGEKVLLTSYDGSVGGVNAAAAAVPNGVGGGGVNNPPSLSNVRLRLRPFFCEHLPVVIRTSLLEEVGHRLKSGSGGGDCDYGRSMLYLLNLLLSKEIKRLKVIIISSSTVVFTKHTH